MHKRRLAVQQLSVAHAVLIGVLWCVFGSMPALATPLMWQVDNPVTGARLYLFGAIHFGQQAMYPLPAEVLNAYHASRTLVVEVDMLAIAPEDVAAALSRNGQNPPGILLQTLVGADLWARLEQVSEQGGIDINGFQNLKPWLTAMRLATIQMRQSGFSDGLGVDRYFLEQATAQDSGKNIIELESLTQQLTIFSEMSMFEQNQFLESALDELGRGDSYLTEVASAWRKGDEMALQELITGGFGGLSVAGNGNIAEKMYQTVFSERNKIMATRLAGLLKNNDAAFVVVGVGHMVGNNGVIKLLENQGFMVSQVTGQVARATVPPKIGI